MHTKLTTSSRTQLPAVGTSWRVTAMTAALGVLLSITHVDAYALALGRITALSSLGEPLAAGIEIPDINADEIASLKATLASPEAFQAAGMEYNPAFANVQITLNKRANGSSYLLVRSDKVVTDPFINLVVNANWSSGRIVRNYTLLLDPPAPKQAEPKAEAAPLTALPAPAPAPAPATTPAAMPTAPVTPKVTAATANVAKPAPAPTNTAAIPKVATQKPATSNSGEKIKVAAGDTAGNIAANHLPANVSLDQMLIALLRGNPQAFIGNNVNRLKAGVVLDLPTEADASAIAADEARRNVIAQSKDFSNFRRKLAEIAPTMAAKSLDRAASGKIEAKVDEKKVAAVTPDKLTLSKGSTKTDDKTSAGTAKDNLDKIAKDRQAKEDANRTAELAKNINDLNKLASTAPAASTSTTTASKSPANATNTATNTPAAAIVAAAPAAVPSTTAPVPSVTTPATATPAAPTPPVAAAKPVVKAPVVVAAAAPKAEPSVIDFLTEDPIVLPAAGGLLALLLGGGLYSINKRKKRKAAEDAEDALLEDNFEERSFFKETTNEPIMEHDEPASPTSPIVAATTVAAKSVTSSDFASSLAPTNDNKPQLAAIVTDGPSTEVDPLTEADVYLDYGRDVQAEEILKEALKTQPNNATIYTKLLGIYSKRRDTKNFEQLAVKVKPLLAGNATEWAMIIKQGFDLEPTNALYADSAPDMTASFASMDSSSEFSTRTVAQLDPESAKSPASVDLDLDFDFVSSFPASSAPEAHKSPLVDLPDFNLAPVAVATAATAVATATALKAAEKPAAMEFDMGGLSLDLNAAPTASKTNQTQADSPMETKLALAHEFRSIGDNIGAKMLINEVIANATGPLKQKAENLLAEIG